MYWLATNMDDWKVKWSMARDEQPNSSISLHLSSSMHDPGTFSNMELDHTPKWFEWSKNLRLEFCKIFRIWILSRMVISSKYVFCVFHTCFHKSKLKIYVTCCDLLVNWPSFHQPLSFNYTKGPLNARSAWKLRHRLLVPSLRLNLGGGNPWMVTMELRKNRSVWKREVYCVQIQKSWCF